MNGDIDMSATTSATAEHTKERDAEVVSIIAQEKEVEIFVVDKK